MKLFQAKFLADNAFSASDFLQTTYIKPFLQLLLWIFFDYRLFKSSSKMLIIFSDFFTQTCRNIFPDLRV